MASRNGPISDAKLPKVRVYNKTKPVKNNPGLASRVALIGPFEKITNSPVLCKTLDEAYEKLGTDVNFKGVNCLDKLFYGASSILAVNTTTKSGSGENITYDQSLTPTKLTEALSKIVEEDFDMIFLAYHIEENILSILTAFLDKKFYIKQPAGYIGYHNSGNPNLAGDFCYGLIRQSLIVNGEMLEGIESSAYYCGVIASLNVGNSMTMKVVPGVTGVSPELSFENGGSGLELLNDGLTAFKCVDRNNGRYVVVNSEQPNGLDIYINRVRDFVVREMSLQEFLGDRNRTATLNEIKQELDKIKERCVNILDLLEDIEYRVEKKTINCVDVYIDKLLFAGIITEIDVYITIEVE